MNENETLAGLLDRWSKVAPEECAHDEYDHRLYDLGRDSCARVQPNVPLETDAAAKILYHALTCAARRGLTPSLEHSVSGDWVAMNDSPSTYERASTPEVAVLSAYVAALEAAQP